MLRQLPDLLRNEETVNSKEVSVSSPEKALGHIQSRFFTDHLKAFNVWISRGGSALTKLGPGSLAPASSDGVFDVGTANGSGEINVFRTFPSSSQTSRAATHRSSTSLVPASQSPGSCSPREVCRPWTLGRALCSADRNFPFHIQAPSVPGK